MLHRLVPGVIFFVVLCAAWHLVLAQPDPADFARLPQFRAGPISPDGAYAVVYYAGKSGRRVYGTGSRVKRPIGPRHSQELRLLSLGESLSLFIPDANTISLTSWWIDNRFLLIKRQERSSGRLLGLRLLDLRVQKKRALKRGTPQRNPEVQEFVQHRSKRGAGWATAQISYWAESVSVPLPASSDDFQVLSPVWGTKGKAIIGITKSGSREVQVFRFDANELSLEPVELGLPHVVSWLFDVNGQARAALQKTGGNTDSLYFRNPSNTWTRAAIGPTGWARLLSFDVHGKRVWLSSSLDRERYAIFWLSTAGGKIEGPLFEDPEFDVVDIMADPKDGHLLYVRNEAERLRCVYFDAQGSLFHVRVDAALPHTSNEVLSTTLDGSRSIIAARSGSVPTTYYLLDMHNNVLVELFRSRPWLQPGQLGATQMIQFKNRAGQRRWGKLTHALGKPKGSAPMVVMLHDAPGGKRLYSRFDPMSQMLASAGFSVLAIDHTGTSGYGKSVSGENNHALLGAIDSDVWDAIRWAKREQLVASGQICVLGTGMGGRAAAMTLVGSPGVRCAVAIRSKGTRISKDTPVGDAPAPQPPRALLAIHEGSDSGGKIAAELRGPGSAHVDQLSVDLGGIGMERRTNAEYRSVLDFLRQHLQLPQQQG